MTATDSNSETRALSPALIASLVQSVVSGSRWSGESGVRYRDQHSNDVAEVAFDDGRTLMVKRGRYSWTAARFRGSRIAAELVNSHTRLVVPDPLPIPDALGDELLEAYWRVELPTLQEVWPALGGDRRTEVLRSWGELLRRLHQVELSGHGPIYDAHEGSCTLSSFLRNDLGGRLLPAVRGCWAEGTEIVESLLAIAPAIAARIPNSQATLIHNDVHMGNVLCGPDGGVAVRCVGLIDLEAAHGGPPEADLAIMVVLHGAHFEQPLNGDWFAHVVEGYAREPDPEMMSFYRTYHLVNLGFYSALVGHAEHAAQVAGAAYEELALWRA
jgi:aminoglycoside phosphotransferase (APT) family kinase protein